MNDHGLLFNALIYLSAAVIAVPFAKRLGLGSVLGYLLAGVVIGPWGLGIITNVEDILHFSEFGVVLLLFLIGLELDPQRLWSMRKPILGMGIAQVIGTTLAIHALGRLVGLDFNTALIAGMGLSLSSTAIALQTLSEKNLLPTVMGNAGLSVLLFQDIAVIPMLAFIPLLGAGGIDNGEPNIPLFIIKVIAVIGVIVVGGRYLTQPIFRIVARTRLRELFTAFSLLLVIGIALLTESVGLSMALGAFLAGVVLAESEYRHALETDIEPVKGLLLGLFFIGVGMSVDFSLLLHKPLFVIGLVAVLITTKLAVLFTLGRYFGLPPSQIPMFAFLLAAGGEFAFVLFSVATSDGVIDNTVADTLVVVVALSMMTTPLLTFFNERVIEPRYTTLGKPPADEIKQASNPVIIAGFGRVGQIVGRLLHANNIPTTLLDHDPDQIEMTRNYGFKVFYGDASRIDLLEAAGAAKAKIIVLAIDDRQTLLKMADLVQQHFPHLKIIARAWDMVHLFDLMDQGIGSIYRETFDAALAMGQEVMTELGYGAYEARRAAQRFVKHDLQTISRLYAVRDKDLVETISISTQAREELEKLMQSDEESLQAQREAGWS
jgi:glutathione-regulated potassium-efflux system ancillary protein KefC